MHIYSLEIQFPYHKMVVGFGRIIIIHYAGLLDNDNSDLITQSLIRRK